MSTAELLLALKHASPQGASTDPDTVRTHATDRSGHPSGGTPLAVVHPSGTPEIQAVLRAVSAAGGSVVTRGAGTGVAGGATAGEGQVVLCLEHLDAILEVSSADLTARVQPGILNGALNAELATRGLWWAPDPASKDISSVGGNIATNAGGLLCAKYGVTRESVLALDVVLADGSLVKLGHNTVKGVTGYDLTALLVGSEGTLGVIAEATLKLRPVRRSAEVTLLAVFGEVAGAVKAAQDVVASGTQPAIMEIMDEPTVAHIVSYLGTDPTDGGGAVLLVQTDGAAAASEAEEVASVLRAGARSVTIAASEEEAEAMLAFRRAVFPAFERQGSTLVEDIAVPRSRMAEAFARMREIEAEFGVSIPTAAHAGDGNLHPIFIYAPDASVQGGVPASVWAAAGAIFETALALGGTLTGEHGIGVLKKRWLGDELGGAQLALQSRVRDAFDPARVLNPGKVLD